MTNEPWQKRVQIGDCTLYLGDCLEILPVLGKVDAVVTDPPYGIGDAPMIDLPGRGGRGNNNYHPPSEWDKNIDPAWGRVCDVAGVIAWFGQWRKREEIAAFMKWSLRAEIIWSKSCHMGPPSPLAPRDERIWIFSETGITGATFETSVWDHAVIPTWEHREHKNQKPISLMIRLIRWVGADFILDPFMGSGTTGVACAKLGRKFIGIEIEPSYFDIACKRIKEAYRQPDLFIERPPKPKQESML